MTGLRSFAGQAVDFGAFHPIWALIEEQTGSFGHTIYLNLSVLFATTPVLPGAEPAAWENLLFGVGSTADVPKLDNFGQWGMARRLTRMVAVIAGATSETRRMDREARRQQRDAGYYACMTDEQLHCQLRCTRDEVVNAWAVAGLASLAVVPIVAIIEKQAGKRFATQFRGGTESLVSAGLIRGAHELGELACADVSIATILAESDPCVALSRLEVEHPRFAARLHGVIAEYGHRGPGETELINPVFADSPARLLDVVVKLTRTAERTVQPQFEQLDDSQRELVAALDRLPRVQREVLVMKIWNELTFAEIGEALGVSQNTAASRYRYGLAALKKAFQPQ